MPDLTKTNIENANYIYKFLAGEVNTYDNLTARINNLKRFFPCDLRNIIEVDHIIEDRFHQVLEDAGADSAHPNSRKRGKRPKPGVKDKRPFTIGHYRSILVPANEKIATILGGEHDYVHRKKTNLIAKWIPHDADLRFYTPKDVWYAHVKVYTQLVGPKQAKIWLDTTKVHFSGAIKLSKLDYKVPPSFSKRLEEQIAIRREAQNKSRKSSRSTNKRSQQNRASKPNSKNNRMISGRSIGRSKNQRGSIEFSPATIEALQKKLKRASHLTKKTGLILKKVVGSSKKLMSKGIRKLGGGLDRFNKSKIGKLSNKTFAAAIKTSVVVLEPLGAITSYFDTMRIVRASFSGQNLTMLQKDAKFLNNSFDYFKVLENQIEEVYKIKGDLIEDIYTKIYDAFDEIENTYNNTVTSKALVDGIYDYRYLVMKEYNNLRKVVGKLNEFDKIINKNLKVYKDLLSFNSARQKIAKDHIASTTVVAIFTGTATIIYEPYKLEKECMIIKPMVHMVIDKLHSLNRILNILKDEMNDHLILMGETMGNALSLLNSATSKSQYYPKAMLYL